MLDVKIMIPPYGDLCFVLESGTGFQGHALGLMELASMFGLHQIL